MTSPPTLPRNGLFVAAMCLAWGGCAGAPGVPEMAHIQCIDRPIAPDPTDGFERIRLMDVCWRTANPIPKGGIDEKAAPSQGDRLIWGRYVAFAEPRPRSPSD